MKLLQLRNFLFFLHRDETALEELGLQEMVLGLTDCALVDRDCLVTLELSYGLLIDGWLCIHHNAVMSRYRLMILLVHSLRIIKILI